MTKRSRKDAEAMGFPQQILVDAEDDDEQLWAPTDTIAAAAKTPADAFVVGEPVQVTAVSYEGNPRVGLVSPG